MGKLLIARFLFLAGVLLLSFNGQAQSIIADSLKAIIDKPGATSGEQIEAMVLLSKIMVAQNKLPEALRIAKEAQQISHRKEDGRYGALAQLALFKVLSI